MYGEELQVSVSSPVIPALVSFFPGFCCGFGNLLMPPSKPAARTGWSAIHLPSDWRVSAVCDCEIRAILELMCFVMGIRAVSWNFQHSL